LHEKWKREANCEKCLPILFPENRDVIEVYGIVRTQLIMSFDGAIAIDANAIETVMKYLDIQDKKRVFLKVLGLGNYMISKMREKK
jgi:hypothetical protein